MKTEWFTPAIDTNDFPESPTYGINDKNDTKAWSNKALKNVPQSDSNLNKILDFVENNKNTLSLVNTLSTTTLKPKQALRIDTSLEDTVSRINDDTSRIQLEVLRIDDLDEKKSYSAQNAQWGEIQNQYYSLSGSEKLKDGHAVWVLTSRNENKSRITLESRMYSEQDVLLRSERNTILVGPSTLQVTVIGSSSLESSQTIRAGDPSGLNIFLDATGPLASTADVTLQDYVT